LQLAEHREGSLRVKPVGQTLAVLLGVLALSGLAAGCGSTGSTASSTTTTTLSPVDTNLYRTIKACPAAISGDYVPAAISNDVHTSLIGCNAFARTIRSESGP
jgi:hypothetical protein